MNPLVRNKLSTTVTAAVVAGVTLIGATLSANGVPTGTDRPAATKDPGCEVFGWRHPQCAGGAWDDDETASEEWGPADNGNPVLPNSPGQMEPNIDGGLSLPGTPGTI